MYKKTVIIFFFVFMLPMLAPGQSLQKSMSKISFDFMDADIRNVLRILTEVSGKNIIVTEDVKGKITMKLENVSWSEALDIITKTNDLVKLEEENIIRVTTSKKYDEEKLRESKRQDEFFKEKFSRYRQGLDLVSKEIRMRYASADEVAKWLKGETTSGAIMASSSGQAPTNRPSPTSQLIGGVGTAEGTRTRGLLSEFGTVTVVPWNNRIVSIKDTKDIIEEIERRLKELDVAPEQVQIEARIVEASTDFSRNLGIKWTARGGTTYQGTPASTTLKITEPATSATGTLGVLIGSAANSSYLDLELSALERDGKGKVIASPKVVTSNYKKALIKSGREIPYQSAGQYGTNIEFKQAELSLEVTPQALGESIKLKIRATKNEPDTTVAANPPIITRVIDTDEVIIKDGETIVLGGIYDNNDTSTTEGIPILKDIPILGWLFKKQEVRKQKVELLIFVTPRIIKNLYKEEG